MKYVEYVAKFENVFRKNYYTDFLEIFEIDDDPNLFMFLENKIDNFVCTSIDKKEIELVLKETYNIRESRILEIFVKGFCDNISRYTITIKELKTILRIIILQTIKKHYEKRRNRYETFSKFSKIPNKKY